MSLQGIQREPCHLFPLAPHAQNKHVAASLFSFPYCCTHSLGYLPYHTENMHLACLNEHWEKLQPELPHQWQKSNRFSFIFRGWLATLCTFCTPVTSLRGILQLFMSLSANSMAFETIATLENLRSGSTSSHFWIVLSFTPQTIQSCSMSFNKLLKPQVPVREQRCDNRLTWLVAKGNTI